MACGTALPGDGGGVCREWAAADRMDGRGVPDGGDGELCGAADAITESAVDVLEGAVDGGGDCGDEYCRHDGRVCGAVGDGAGEGPYRGVSAGTGGAGSAESGGSGVGADV